MFYIVALVLLCTVLLHWLYTRHERIWKLLLKFPGPKTVPIFGNLLQLGQRPEDYLSTMFTWCKESHFQCMRAFLGPMSYLFLNDVKAVEHVLSSTTLTYKEDLYSVLLPWLGNGLLVANDEKWQKHRKMITPSFHFQILIDFLRIMNETTDRFKLLLDSYAEKGELFDLQNVVTRSTIDIICESAMGTRVNSIEGNESIIVTKMNELCDIMQNRIFSWLNRFDLFFFFTPMYHKQRKALKILKAEISEIINARRQTLQHNAAAQSLEASSDVDFKRPKMAFLDNLLTAQIDGRPLTFLEIFEEVSTFMFEGHDTTASAISFAIYCLALHPDVQQRAYEEQLNVFGTEEHHATYQELQDMKYLELVIKETLRLFPSVPFIGRTLRNDIEFEGRTVPKGTSLVCPIVFLGRNERLFAEPNKFRPERFEPEKRIHVNPFDQVPFSAGSRNCIGQKFAMMELKVTLSKIIRNFHILPSDDSLYDNMQDNLVTPERGAVASNPHALRLAVFVTLKSVNGVYVRLKPRK